MPAQIVAFPEAERGLSEYGNLEFKEPSQHVRIDPSVGEEIIEEIRKYEEQIGTSLYPIGILEGGDTLFLLIDTRGVVYAMSDELEPFASSLDRAIEYLARPGTRSREWRTDLGAIGMVGKKWRPD